MYSKDEIDKISKLKWEVKHILIEPKSNKTCSITKSKRFDSYIFQGYGSKNLAKRYMFFNNEYQILTQIFDKKGFRQFVPFKSWTECWDLYKHTAYDSRYLYELILSDKPCKPYLDIEWKEKDANKNDYTTFLSQLKKDITNIFLERYKIELDNTNFMISSAHSSEKVSFHLVINKNIAYETNVKRVSNSAWDLYIALVTLNPKYKEQIDEAVYSLDREFRTIYSNKFDSYRPLVPLGCVFHRGNFCVNPLEHLVTNFNNLTPTLIITPEYIHKNKEILSKISKIGELKGNHITDNTETDIVLRIKELVHPIHPSAIYTGKIQNSSGWRFSYSDRTETCYSGYVHQNNGFGVYIKPSTGQVYMYCFSKKCQQLFFLGYLDRNEEWKHEVLKINQQFLDYKDCYTIHDSFTKEGTMFFGFINNFIKNGGVYAIKSSMGTGKTRLLEKMIEKNFMDKRILYLSHRQTFTQNIHGSFAKYGFGNYLDKEYHKNKIIIQLDSLLNLINNGKLQSYDFVILDEIESLLAHLSSVTLKTKRIAICKLLECILQNAKWILALDADFDNRSYEFLSKIKEKPKVIVNEYKPTKKKFLFNSNYELRKFQLNEDIKNNKKVVVICLCKNTMDELYEFIKKDNPKIKLIRYSSMTDDSQKLDLKDVNNIWNKYDVILYTPTIESGVDFNVKNYFNRMYCFLSNNSCSPRSFLQMVGRIRDLGDNDIRCYFDKSMLFTDKDIYIPTINEFEEFQISNDSTKYDLDVVYNKIGGTIDIKVNKSAFTRIFAYNSYENYIKNYKFLRTLKELLIIKSFTYINEDIGEKNIVEEINDDDKSENKETLKNSSIVDEPNINDENNEEINTTVSSKKSIYEIDELLIAPLISTIRATEIEHLKNTNKATRIDKLCLKRYFIEKKFKLKENEFTIEFLLSWYSKEYILDNALYALHKKDYTTDTDRILIDKRLKYLTTLLGIYGFDNIFDFNTKIIKDDALEQKMKDSKLLDKENYTELMKVYGKKIRAEHKIGFCVDKFTIMTNSVLNEYGINIESTRKQIKKNNQRTWIYTYQLQEERTNIQLLCSRYL